jgi:hypothetical protein
VESNVQHDGARLSAELQELAQAMLRSQSRVDHPVITRCALSSSGVMGLAEGSPYLLPENRDAFQAALLPDVSLMSVEPAPPVFRDVETGESYPIPESCRPYLDANALGFILQPVLPIVFVRTRQGELLGEARVALKYLRENARTFPRPLKVIEEHARRVLRPDVSEAERPRWPWLLTDLVQPYSSFTARHVSFRAGLWVRTPPGISTVIGPLANRPSPLAVVTGAIETDWHWFELFVVAEVPLFEGQVLLIEPGAPLAQLHFAARDAGAEAELCFSATDPGGEPGYAHGWEVLGARLLEAGRMKFAQRVGVGSVGLGCPHCFVSVTRAAEGHLEPEHVARRGFNPAYRLLQREHRSLAGLGDTSARTTGGRA